MLALRNGVMQTRKIMTSAVIRSADAGGIPGSVSYL